MPKPPYILGAMKSAKLLVGAAHTRTTRAAHHIDKMGDDEAAQLAKQALIAEKRLYDYLDKQIAIERRKQ
jgi:hypothetical protein